MCVCERQLGAEGEGVKKVKEGREARSACGRVCTKDARLQSKTISQLLTPDDVRSESGNALSCRNLFFYSIIDEKRLGAQDIKKTQRE